MEIVIGIDAGGTRTTLAAVSMSGEILAWKEWDSININSLDAALCHSRLREAVAVILKETGCAEYHLAISSCALDNKADTAQCLALTGDSSAMSVLAHTDAFMTLIASTGGGPGCVLISGTGCMGLAINKKGDIKQVAGYGWKITQDEGGAYYAANRGIAAVIHHWEGYGPPTLLTERLLARYQLRDVRDILRPVYEENLSVGEIARFAVDVTECARLGDGPAMEIINELLGIWLNLADVLCAHAGDGSVKFGLYGGMFQHNGDLMERFATSLRMRHPRAQIGLPALHPALGAALYWFMEKGQSARDIYDTMGRFTPPQ